MPNGESHVNQVIKKRCPVCGREFTPVRPWHTYDRPACGAEARNRRRWARIREAVKLLDRFKGTGRTGAGR